MGGIYNELMALINDLRAQRKLVESAPGMNSEKKRQIMNDILAGENMALQQFFVLVSFHQSQHVLLERFLHQ